MQIQLKFDYKVKITNPARKSDVVVRHLHHFHGKFDSLLNLHVKLVEEFKEQVPDSLSFNIGYFEGQKHAKMLMGSEEDLQAMYMRYPSGEVTLWCDGRKSEENGSAAKKRKREDVASNYHDKAEEVEDIYQELMRKHSENYDIPKLRLWARAIASSNHKSMDHPPEYPPFSSTPKRTRQESLSTTISGAAIAIAQALGGGKKNSAPDQEGGSFQVDLRMKNFEQLRYLKQLYDDNILTEEEFYEQKENILTSLKKL
ncbi:hypothetical protein SPONN_1479 [uncultured Candidatus Thioglobus sp.]|nr:hypothetical protein SPONN_1479 [uncultured Candidatus Thioglobus sp.]